MEGGGVVGLKKVLVEDQGKRQKRTGKHVAHETPKESNLLLKLIFMGDPMGGGMGR